ncbi:MAG: protein-L-isoaspartate(D-aspartate) O-methyltransferase [Elusimicrobia bacterium]|nr:protein-L-isoaspartate(D-aspartate) O-methyltransferase [Elusimicrobiota bacterium]
MDFEQRRARMVREQLEARGISDRRVLDAFKAVERHLFLEPGLRPDAYEDRPVPIGLGQTISQPYIVAYMAELLELAGSERVLELGAGSGYAAAILGRLAREVFAVELEPELCRRASAALEKAGTPNVRLREGDGLEGWPERAPFDRIMASAALSEVPPALLAQLRAGGWFLGPIGQGPSQRMTKIRRTGEGLETQTLAPVLFVPVRRRSSGGHA